SPIGPAMPPASRGDARCSGAVMYSPGVPAGAVGGGTWSKKPPFSSNVTKTTVFAQTAGLLVRAFRTWATVASPHTGGAGGCSESIRGASTHDTCGSAPAVQSASKVPGAPCPKNVGPNALAASVGLV